MIMNEQIRKRMEEERQIKQVLNRKYSISNLLRKIRLDENYAKGFYKQLCKKGFLDRRLAIFFYNIIIYIEDLYFAECFDKNINRYKKF